MLSDLTFKQFTLRWKLPTRNSILKRALMLVEGFVRTPDANNRGGSESKQKATVLPAGRIEEHVRKNFSRLSTEWSLGRQGGSRHWAQFPCNL
jgi:hypothetical protein